MTQYFGNQPIDTNDPGAPPVYAAALSDPRLGGTGKTVVDFGGAPGSTDQQVVISGQAGILADSTIQAWVYPLETPEHSVEEHMGCDLRPFGYQVVPGASFVLRVLSFQGPVSGRFTIAWRWQ